jgi:hypothetical protein
MTVGTGLVDQRLCGTPRCILKNAFVPAYRGLWRLEAAFQWGGMSDYGQE